MYPAYEAFVVSKSLVELEQAGYVKLVDFTPNMVPQGRSPDFRIVEAARMSVDQKLKSEKQDLGLIKYLYLNKHTSPFEMCQLTFECQIPIFIARQLMRHRTFKFNEYSQRYTTAIDEYYHLDAERFSLQSTKNKQLSASITQASPEQSQLICQANEHIQALYDIYHKLVDSGQAREDARTILPVAGYTKVMFSCDLHNFIHFCRLRSDKDHAQRQIVELTEAMIELAEQVFPLTMQLFKNEQNKKD